MERITVYCGSSPGRKTAYMDAAISLGRVLAHRNITLVYGGGSVGLMGGLARTVVEQGGKVIGVIPKAIAEMEVAFTELQDLRVVEDMHSRKKLMADLADAFIALPGGLGTVEELMEILTWSQLGFHQKPAGVLNIAGFFNPMLTLLGQLADDQFIAPEHKSMLLVDESPEGLLEKFTSYESPKVDKAQRALKLSRSQEPDQK